MSSAKENKKEKSDMGGATIKDEMKFMSKIGLRFKKNIGPKC